MELLTQFLHIKDEPMAAFVFMALVLYKALSLILTFIKDRYFLKPNKFQQTLMRDIVILKIYNLNLSIEDRLESLFDYLYAGYNGEVLAYGIRELIIPHKDKWAKIYRKKMEESPDFNPKKNFELAMQTINQIPFDKGLI
jgi:hypothetical protein